MKVETLVNSAICITMMSGALGAANAATTALGNVAINVPTSFGGFAPVGRFDDMFTFTLPANGGSGYSVTNFTALPGAFNTVLTTMSLVSNPDGILLNTDDTLLSSSVVPGGNSIAMTWGPNSGGKMYLMIGGIGNGTSGGIYTGAIGAAAVTAVPEPENYAMLLAGLGVMGAIAMRRNKSKAN